MLLTGAIRPITRPLAPLFDKIVAADLAVDERGRCTGFLAAPPLVGESRPAWLRHYASLHGDRPGRGLTRTPTATPTCRCCSAVGNAVAVSPDIALMRAANANRWSIVEWKIKPSSPRWILPE